MCKVIQILFLVLLPMCFFSSTAMGQSGKENWTLNCGPAGKLMGIEIVLDGRTIYHSRFRVCRTDSPAFKDYPKQKIRGFYIAGGHTFQGTHRTKKSQKVEGNIWEATSYPDAIALGISFVSGRQIVLNTLQMAYPDKMAESEIDSGLVVKTYPVRSK